MPPQGEFDFPGGVDEAGYRKWLELRHVAVAAMARRMNLPLGHSTEVWLRGGIRLRGILRLKNEVLFVTDENLENPNLVVDGVEFAHGEIESCVRMD